MPVQSLSSALGTAAERLAPGRRRMNLDSIRHEIEARDFDSLPKGAGHPLELLAAVKKARVPLGIPATLIDLLDLLFAFTEARDWQEGTRPIVWPSNRYLADQLGLKRSGIQKRIRQGVALGLFVMKDAPNGQRRGRRAPGSGRIVLEASYGFDLSPLAVRYQEFRDAGDRHREAYRAREACRKRGFIAKSALLQLMETAEEEGVWSAYWEGLEARLEPLFGILKASDRHEELTYAAETLEGFRAEAEALLTAALANRAPATPESAAEPVSDQENNPPMGSLLGALKNTTDSPPLSSDTGKKGHREESSASGTGSARQPTPGAGQGASPRQEVEDRVALSVVLEAVPDLAAFCPQRYPTWNEVADAAQRICAHWEISQRNWGRACKVLGRAGAALAFAVMAHQHARGGVASPGGYFYRMIERAERGELDLIRSYHGIRTRLYGRDRRTAH